MILHVEGFNLIYYTKKMGEKRRRTRHLKNAQNPATGEKPVRRTKVGDDARGGAWAVLVLARGGACHIKKLF
ncbi:hypothetical protein C1H46_006970 [Malus baccata]|uniref:Uncharacterized protein n=1 Tax=Malus baccata TaxID=106549 RepID=A0A540N8E7_MALBA|nr:hypothetical protein C1H46_006970 [Malus baccata]